MDFRTRARMHGEDGPDLLTPIARTHSGLEVVEAPERAPNRSEHEEHRSNLRGC